MKWRGEASNKLMFGALLVTGVVLLLVPAHDSLILVRASAVLAVYLAVTFASVRVTVTDDSVTIDLGPLHWPRKTIALADVESASLVDVRPLRYGGWGYRWCGWGCRAFVIRSGEGLRITTNKGKSVMVTVEDAAAGLGYLSSPMHDS